MWIDGTANLTRTIKQNGQDVVIDYSTTIEGVRDLVRKCKMVGVNMLVVDVKPLSGQVLYKSRIAPRMKQWRGRDVPDFDILAAFVDEGHKAGLSVHASVNILSEGHKYFSVGPAYQRPEWQSIVYVVDRGMIATQSGKRMTIRVPGEPSDPAAPTMLTDARAIMDSEQSGMVGLESVDSRGGVVNREAQVGKQLNVVLDENNRVVGMIDSALIGDDLLTAPEGGKLIPAAREADQNWCSENLKLGSQVYFDMRTNRVPIAQAPSEKIACFVNILHPEARKYELDMVREIVTNYNIDGFVLDRCRFSNLYNDFSDRSREAFEEWLSRNSRKNLSRWPQDIYEFPKTPYAKMKLGPLYKEWLEFRAQVIRDFVSEVARSVRSLKPSITLGTYVGSWYPSYYEVGVNWGSPKNRIRYPWQTPDYGLTGYAEFFDWISTGCYFATATIDDAAKEGISRQQTVEWAARNSDLAVASGAFVYPGVYALDFVKRPDAFLRAVEAAGRQGQGWMIFDVSHINDYNWWSYLQSAFGKPVQSPDSLKSLLPVVRSARDGLP